MDVLWVKEVFRPVKPVQRSTQEVAIVVVLV
jgi:hypothetical protein